MTERRTGRRGRYGWRLAAGGVCLLLAGAAGAQSPVNTPAPRPALAAPGGSDNGDSAALTGQPRESREVAAGPPSGTAERAAPLRVAPAGTTAPSEALAQAVLTVDQEAIYRQSRWGQRAQDEIAAQSRQVAADNDREFAALVADEDALTAARATLGAEEFRRRATAFDERVTAVRQERDAARIALNAMADRDRALFFRAAAPVLGQIMEARGALVVLDQRTVLISDERIDVTAATIAALDAALGDGQSVIDAAVAAEKAAAEERGVSGANPPSSPDGIAPGSAVNHAVEPPSPDAQRAGSAPAAGAQAGSTPEPPSTSAPEASVTAPAPRPQRAAP